MTKTKLAIYFLLVIGLTGVQVYLDVEQSRKAYEAGDRSAYAWVGFLPYILPVYLVVSIVTVAAAAIGVEVIQFLVRFFKR